MEKVAPYCYIHVLDSNSNVTRVVFGPTTYTKQDHEKIVFGPERMIVIPPRHYAVIKDPAVREDNGEAKKDKFGQVQLRHGDREIRFQDEWADPFALLPGESLEGDIQQVPLVEADTALRLTARRDFTAVEDEKEVKRVAGDEWLFYGPNTYRPRVEVEVIETVVATIIQTNHALKLRARNTMVDKEGRERKNGEEWVVRIPGAYLPDVYEDIVAVVEPTLLTQTRALYLRATDSFQDVYKIDRKAGQEWLVTLDMAELHIPDVNEEKVGVVDITVLNKSQYAVITDPVDGEGKNQYGKREVRVGPTSFFLLPGEGLEDGHLKDVFVLTEEEALLLKATETFDDEEDGKQVTRTPGDLWMIHGPCDYVPRVGVEVVEPRRNIPLDDNEGIYVRDIRTGQVRSIRGKTYMLKANEALWEKELPEEVEALLDWSYYKGVGGRDEAKRQSRVKTEMVRFRVPHNAAVQVYDYKAKESRVVFGPGLVMLQPDEQFTVNRLSGDKPKRPNVITSLALLLGPDFMTDIFEVETSDHARLKLQLSYNWCFQIDKSEENKEQHAHLFQVRDFVGDACKAIASRVRGAVASVNFDQFHKESAKMIRAAVFGVDEHGKVGDYFLFTANQLKITNIDIQSVEPVDERTRESLQKSVQLAIEITTRKQERNARHKAQEIEQVAKGTIERQKLLNQTESELERQKLVELQSSTKALQSTGTAKAEAEAKAEYLEIEAEADVEKAKLAADASEIEAAAELEEISATQALEIEHQKALLALEVKKNQTLSELEATKFRDLVGAISPQTIKAIASAGPEMQARLLKGLGLKGYLLTDGNSPVNLFNAAKGMVGQNAGMM